MPSKPTRKTRSSTEKNPSRSKAAAPKTRRAPARGGKATPIPEVVEGGPSTSATEQELHTDAVVVDPSTDLQQPTAAFNVEIEPASSRATDAPPLDPLPSVPPVANPAPSSLVVPALPTPKPMSLGPPKMITSHRRRHIPVYPSPLAVHKWSPEFDDRLLEHLTHEGWLRKVRLFNKNPNLIPCSKPSLIDAVHFGFIANHVECPDCAQARFDEHDVDVRPPNVPLLLFARDNGFGYPLCRRPIDLGNGRTRLLFKCEFTRRMWAHVRPRLKKEERVIITRCVHYPAKQPNSAAPREPNATVIDFERRIFRVVLPPEKAYVQNDPRPLRRHNAVFLDEIEPANHALDLNALPPAPPSPLSDSDLELEEYPSDSEDSSSSSSSSPSSSSSSSSSSSEEADIAEVDVSLVADAPDSSPPLNRKRRTDPNPGPTTSSSALNSQPETSTSALPIQQPTRSESPVLQQPPKSRKGKGKAKELPPPPPPPQPKPSKARQTKRQVKPALATPAPTPAPAKATRGGKKRTREAEVNIEEAKEPRPTKRPRRQARGREDDAMDVEPSGTAASSKPGPSTGAGGVRRSARLALKNVGS